MMNHTFASTERPTSANGQQNSRCPQKKTEQPPLYCWVTLKRYSQLTGYTPGAMRQKIRRNQVIEGVHWHKSPDGRIQINVPAMQEWASH